MTISTLGNSADFGDSTYAGTHTAWGSNAIRGVSFGGELQPSGDKINVIDFVTISTAGNATDFGDLTVARRFPMGFSDVHGGLAQ